MEDHLGLDRFEDVVAGGAEDESYDRALQAGHDMHGDPFGFHEHLKIAVLVGDFFDVAAVLAFFRERGRGENEQSSEEENRLLHFSNSTTITR